ncbi:unnamed protein product, partial [Gulo gulo]
PLEKARLRPSRGEEKSKHKGQSPGQSPTSYSTDVKGSGAAKSPPSLAQTVVLCVGCPHCPLPGRGRKSKTYRRLLLL